MGDESPAITRSTNNGLKGKQSVLRLDSETLDTMFDDTIMTTPKMTTQSMDTNGTAASFDTVHENGSTEKKVARLKSIFESKSPEPATIGTNSSPVKGSAESNDKDGMKPTRAALTRYQSHLSQLKLGSFSVSPMARDTPAFTFDGPAAQVHEPVHRKERFNRPPLGPEQLPQMGLTPVSYSSSIDPHDYNAVTPATVSGAAVQPPPVVSPAAVPTMPPTPTPVGIASSDATSAAANMFQNPASALLMTAALNALTQANTSADPHSPLTSAITAASAQILAAALAQAQPQMQMQTQTLTQATPLYPGSVGAGPYTPTSVQTYGPPTGPVPMPMQGGQGSRYQQYGPGAGMAAGSTPPVPSAAPAQRGLPNSDRGSNTKAPAPRLNVNGPPSSLAGTRAAGAGTAGMVRTKSLTFSDVDETEPAPTSRASAVALSAPSTESGFPDAASGNSAPYTPPASYKDFLARYSGGLDAVQAVRDGALTSAGGSYRYGVSGTRNTTGTEADDEAGPPLSTGAEAVNRSTSTDVFRGLDVRSLSSNGGEMATVDSPRRTLLSRNPALQADNTNNTDNTKDDTTNDTKDNTNASPHTPPRELPTHVLSKQESRRMMDVLLVGVESKSKRGKAETIQQQQQQQQQQQGGQHYSRMFHSCDPRVFEASYERKTPSTPGDGTHAGAAAAVGGASTPGEAAKSPYRSTMAQLVASSPGYIKVHTLRFDAVGEGSVQSGGTGDGDASGNKTAAAAVTPSQGLTAGRSYVSYHDESGDFGHFGDTSQHDEFDLPMQRDDSSTEPSSKYQPSRRGTNGESMFNPHISTNMMKRPLVRHGSADSAQMEPSSGSPRSPVDYSGHSNSSGGGGDGKGEKGLPRTFSAHSARSQQSQGEDSTGAGRKEGDFGSSQKGVSRKEGDFERFPRLLSAGGSTRGMHKSFKFDHQNKKDLVGRETTSVKGQGKLHSTALDFVQDQCLNSIDAKNLKLASRKNRNVLIGWQILILRKGELSLLGKLLPCSMVCMLLLELIEARLMYVATPIHETHRVIHTPLLLTLFLA